MPKTHTKMKAGRAVAIYVHDGQGRRLVVATASSDNLIKSQILDTVVVIASTRAEAREAIAVLHQLAEELPE